MTALVEALTTARLRTNKRKELNNSWREEARQLSRTDDVAYKDAARALQEALLKTNEMVNDEREKLNTVIARVGTCAKILPPTVDQFADAYLLEAKGPSELDALALACILEDARELDTATDRALLAFDRKAVETRKAASVSQDLKSVDIKVFVTPDELAP